MIAHNGEINTVRGNKNWMKSHEIRMVSETFGEHVERCEAGHSGLAHQIPARWIPYSKCCASRAGLLRWQKRMLIPEAWSKRDSVDADIACSPV